MGGLWKISIVYQTLLRILVPLPWQTATLNLFGIEPIQTPHLAGLAEQWEIPVKYGVAVLLKLLVLQHLIPAVVQVNHIAVCAELQVAETVHALVNGVLDTQGLHPFCGIYRPAICRTWLYGVHGNCR